MALINAITEGDITKAERMIKEQYDINEKGEICKYKHNVIDLKKIKNKTVTTTMDYQWDI